MRATWLQAAVVLTVMASSSPAALRRDPLAMRAVTEPLRVRVPAVKLWLQAQGRTWAPGDVLHAGTAFHLYGQTSEPLHVGVLQLEANADAVQVYPPASSRPEAPLGPHVVHKLSAGQLRLGPLPGWRPLVVMFSRRPLEVLDRLADRPPEAARRLALALSRPDLVFWEQLAAEAVQPGPGLYVAAPGLGLEDLAAVRVDVVGQAPREDAPVRAPPPGRGLVCFLVVPAAAVQPVPPDQVFRSGDGFVLKVRPTADLYCRVLQELPGARAVELFPRGERAFLVRAGQTVAVPADGLSRFDHVPGVERFTLVFSAKPFGPLSSPPAPGPGMSDLAQYLYTRLFVPDELTRLRAATHARASDFRCHVQAAPAEQVGLHVMDLNPDPASPAAVDLPIVHR